MKNGQHLSFPIRLNIGTFLKQMNDLNEFAISSDRSNHRQSRVLVTNVSILRSLLLLFFLIPLEVLLAYMC